MEIINRNIIYSLLKQLDDMPLQPEHRQRIRETRTLIIDILDMEVKQNGNKK